MKIGRKQTVPAVLIMVIAAFAAVWAIAQGGGKETVFRERLEAMLSVTVELQMPGGRGGGVVWKTEDGTVTVLTAAHVAGSVREGDTVTLNGRRQTAAAGSRISEDFDLAFIRIECQEFPDTYRQAQWDQEAFDGLQEGDSIYMPVYREGEPVLLEGKIRNHWIYMEDFGYHMLWGDMSGVEAGASGSGVFDENGMLAGILCGGTDEGEIAVLPLSVILTEWKHIDIR